MERAEVWTVGKVLRWCEDYFRSKGVDSPRLAAELLLSHVLGCPRIRLYVEWGKVLQKEELAQLKPLVKRCAEGEPVAYIVGVREFWSMPFRVDRRVLIPRPETEHVVEAVLEVVARKRITSVTIADIGTGCGNIACALAKSLPTATIIATDVSQEALHAAAENARALGLSERIEFLQGDLLEPLRGRGACDVLASNPPYVAASQWDSLPESVRAYEPLIALYDDSPDGLGAIQRLLREGPQVLAEGGSVVLELGAGQSDRASALAREAGASEVAVKRDLAGHDRVLIASWR